MKKFLSILLILAMTLSLGITAFADDGERPGAAWMDSGIYGVYEGKGEIRPQDDFAAAVNRAWAETAKINDGEANVSARTEQTDVLNREKIALVSGEKKDDAKLTSLQNLYALLLDWDARNAEGVAVLKPFFDDLMGVASIEEMTAFLSDPDRNLYGTPMVVDMAMGNTEDAFTNILYIMSPVMFGSDSFNYEIGDEETPVISVNRQICEYMLGKLGCSEAEAKELFDKTLEFELKLVPGMQAAEQQIMEQGAAAVFSHRFTADELQDMYKNYPLCEIYKALVFDLAGRLVGVMMPDAISCLDTNYNDENLDAIKAWVLTHTLKEFINYCDRETYEETTLLQAPMTGVDSLLPDEVYAMNTITGLVPSLVDEVYVEYCFDKEIKPQVYELTVMMIDAYRDMLREEDWLSDATKAAAIDKLDNIKINVCYPDKLPDVGSLTIKSAEEGGTLFEAIKAARLFARGIVADIVQRRNDGTYWKFDNYYSGLGASYIPTENSINVFAGLCGGDFYQADWPLEKKLGGLCMVVGHEITHAFDDDGATFDKDGNYKDWWTEEDKAVFHERVDKLKAWYKDFVPAPELSDEPYGEEGANRIAGEAISDLGSLKCLLSIAAKQENFDYEMFFTQLAIIQKNARYAAAELPTLANETHPVEYSRCNVPLSNYEEFHETFGVKEGDGMYTAPADRIKVW